MTHVQCVAVTAALLRIEAAIREWSFTDEEAIEAAAKLLNLSEDWILPSSVQEESDGDGE